MYLSDLFKPRHGNERSQIIIRGIPILVGTDDFKLLRNALMYLRWYRTPQGDNSLKSVERFDHMMFVCRFQASR